MAETTKKAKAPGKAKKSEEVKVETVKVDAAKAEPAKKSKAKKTEVSAPAPIRHEDVAQLAHRYWAERGHQHGQHVDDWFRAEQELRGKAS